MGRHPYSSSFPTSRWIFGKIRNVTPIDLNTPLKRRKLSKPMKSVFYEIVTILLYERTAEDGGAVG
jgi:hypothetical protein